MGADLPRSTCGRSQRTRRPTVSTVVGDAGAGVLPGRRPSAPRARRGLFPPRPAALARRRRHGRRGGSRIYYQMAATRPPGWPGASLYNERRWELLDARRHGVNRSALGRDAKASGRPAVALRDRRGQRAHRVHDHGRGAAGIGDQHRDAERPPTPRSSSRRTVSPRSFQFPRRDAEPGRTRSPLMGLLRGRRRHRRLRAPGPPGGRALRSARCGRERRGDDAGSRRARSSPDPGAASGFGTLFEDADIETVINTGRDLAPYAPAPPPGKPGTAAATSPSPGCAAPASAAIGATAPGAGPARRDLRGLRARRARRARRRRSWRYDHRARQPPRPSTPQPTRRGLRRATVPGCTSPSPR